MRVITENRASRSTSMRLAVAWSPAPLALRISSDATSNRSTSMARSRSMVIGSRPAYPCRDLPLVLAFGLYQLPPGIGRHRDVPRPRTLAPAARRCRVDTCDDCYIIGRQAVSVHKRANLVGCWQILPLSGRVFARSRVCRSLWPGTGYSCLRVSGRHKI